MTRTSRVARALARLASLIINIFYIIPNVLLYVLHKVRWTSSRYVQTKTDYIEHDI
jgi:hypothetical protein